MWKIKTLRWMTLASIVGLASGCVTANSSFCDNVRYIWFDDMTQLEQTPMPVKRQILDHNDKVDALCK